MDRNGPTCALWTRIGGAHQGPYRKDARAAIAAMKAAGWAKRIELVHHLCYSLSRNGRLRGSLPNSPTEPLCFCGVDGFDGPRF